jgi:hypothetical protein
MKILKAATVILLTFLVQPSFAAGENELMSTFEEKEKFARDLSSIIGRAWPAWQDAVTIDGIEVEGSSGLLSPGDLGNKVLLRKDLLLGFDTAGRSYDYVRCIRTVVGALANGMGKWQRGYLNRSIPFPQGASCTYTLAACNNIPVTLSSGSSSGDNVMSGESLYNYMVYHSPVHNKDVYEVYRAAASAIESCFTKWRNHCRIAEITASGGIAPSPAPLGSGPGPVRGARGESGTLEGEYFCADEMYRMMLEDFRRKAPAGA